MNSPPGAAAPLSGLKVVVTRAADQAGGFVGRLKSAGAEVVEFPTIQTVPPESTEEMDEAIRGLSGFDYALFTSVNAVKFFLGRMAELGVTTDALKGMKLITVGPKTAAALEELGLTPDITPEEFKAEGVLAALEGCELSGRRVLFPRAETAREAIIDGLKARGAEVVLVVAYRTVPPKVDPGYVRELFAEGGVSAITFTSSSTVKNFVSIVGSEVIGYLKDVCVACIGPVTADTCREMGVPVCVIPTDYTVDALFEALVEHFRRRV